MSPQGNTPRVPPALAREIAGLNPRQRSVIDVSGPVVVRAGPGSGKTRTLVAKIGYLLEVEVPPLQGVAAITYTRQAAAEVTRRLRRLGLAPGRRLTSRTVHSWCLHAILRPYASMVGIPLPGPEGIADTNRTLPILAECLDKLDIAYWRGGRSEEPVITRIRRAIAAGQDVEGFGPERVEAARRFEQRLIDRNLIDYEAMVIRSVDLVTQSAGVRGLLAARYPWIVVDEYQDLGAALHQLVLTLHCDAGIQICAVGDPDQSVMGFTGADPRFLNELASDHGFADIRLDINYRSGSALIAAAQAALGEHRDHRADPTREEPGTLEAIGVNGDLDEHAGLTADRIGALIQQGVRADQIVVLYPGRGPLLSELLAALTAADIPFVHETDDRLPTGPMTEFLRGCAARRLTGPRPCGRDGSTPGPSVPTVNDLFGSYQLLRREAGLSMQPLLPTIGAFQAVLDREPDGADLAGEPVIALVDRLDDLLDLSGISTASGENVGSLAAIRTVYAEDDLTLQAFAGVEANIGKVAVTTYHSAKGREFAFVFMPGLVEGIMPRWTPTRRGPVEPAPPELAEARRAFYVGLTRASSVAVLIYGRGWTNDSGYWNEFGPSRFAVDVIEATQA